MIGINLAGLARLDLGRSDCGSSHNSRGELLANHSHEHINRVESASERGGAWLDGDTFASRASYKAALYSAGGLLRAVDAVLNGEGLLPCHGIERYRVRYLSVLWKNE